MYSYILKYSVSETISAASLRPTARLSRSQAARLSRSQAERLSRGQAARLSRGQAGVGLLVVEPVPKGRSSLSLGRVAAVPEGADGNWTEVYGKNGGLTRTDQSFAMNLAALLVQATN